MQTPWFLPLLVVVELVAACGAPSDDAPSGNVEASETNPSAGRAEGQAERADGRVRPARAPVILAVSGPADVAAGDTFEIAIEIDQRTAAADAQLRVDLPDGATLVDGALSESLPTGAGILQRRLLVHVPVGVPSADVKVTVDAVGTNYGAHAQAQYRFGRAAPLLAEPPRIGAPVTVHGVSLGESIPLG